MNRDSWTFFFLSRAAVAAVPVALLWFLFSYFVR